MPRSTDGDDLFDSLLLAGAVEVAGIDSDTGDFLYSFTEKMLEIAPEIMAEAENIFHSNVMALWEMGFLLMDPSIENPTVSITQKALDEQDSDELSEELRQTLKLIISAMRIS